MENGMSRPSTGQCGKEPWRLCDKVTSSTVSWKKMKRVHKLLSGVQVALLGVGIHTSRVLCLKKMTIVTLRFLGPVFMMMSLGIIIIIICIIYMAASFQAKPLAARNPQRSEWMDKFRVDRSGDWVLEVRHWDRSISHSSHCQSKFFNRIFMARSGSSKSREFMIFCRTFGSRGDIPGVLPPVFFFYPLCLSKLWLFASRMWPRHLSWIWDDWWPAWTPSKFAWLSTTSLIGSRAIWRRGKKS